MNGLMDERTGGWMDGRIAIQCIDGWDGGMVGGWE